MSPFFIISYQLKRNPIQDTIRNDKRFSQNLFTCVGIFCMFGNAVLVLIYVCFLFAQVIIHILTLKYYISLDEFNKLSPWVWIKEVVTIILFCGFTVFCYFLSLYLEKQLLTFLYQKFKSRMVKSHESEQHRPVQRV